MTKQEILEEIKRCEWWIEHYSDPNPHLPNNSDFYVSMCKGKIQQLQTELKKIEG